MVSGEKMVLKRFFFPPLLIKKSNCELLSWTHPHSRHLQLSEMNRGPIAPTFAMVHGRGVKE